MRERIKKLTIKDIAKTANVSTASVDRVINGRDGVKASTREKVLSAIDQLNRHSNTNKVKLTKIAFIVEAGPTFISLVEGAITAFIEENEHEIEYSLDTLKTGQGSSQDIAEIILKRAQEVDGIILMAADSVPVNRAVNQAIEQHIPVICLTSDLPNSNRTAYVGSDQKSVGATAGYLLGRMLPRMPGRILFVASAPYDCQLQRELGFRQALRQEFPHLKIEECIHSQDDSDYSYQSMLEFLKKDRHLDAVYNAAGGNRGIAKALREHNLTRHVVFIGHEISSHTLELLDQREMDLVIGHDVEQEVKTAVNIIRHQQEQDCLSPISIITPYNSI